VTKSTQADRPWADVVRRLSKPIDFRLVSRLEFGAGAVTMRYEPKVVIGFSRTGERELQLTMDMKAGTKPRFLILQSDPD